MTPKQKKSHIRPPPPPPTNTNTNTSSTDSQEHQHENSSIRNDRDLSDSESDTQKLTSKTQPEPTSKRTQTQTQTQVNKGKKKRKGADEEEGLEIEDNKGAMFERLFSEEDELLLLQNMIDIKAKNGMHSIFNIDAIFESVEKKLSCSVTKTQLSGKIRRLRRKFVDKGRNGNDHVLLRPHEYKLFELSKKIWASQVNVDTSKLKTSSSRKKKKVKRPEIVELSEAECEHCWSLYPFLCASLQSQAKACNNFSSAPTPKEYVNKVVNGLTKDKATELDQIWKNISFKVHQLNVERMDAISKQSKASMEVIHP